MFEITGQYNSAHVMLPPDHVLDESTRSQIQRFVNYPIFAGIHIAIMPDTHAGKGSVIGFTAEMNEYVIPNIVGVDIGCGIEAYKIGDVDVNFESFDNQLRQMIPSGFKTRSKPHKEVQTRTDPFWDDKVLAICKKQGQDSFRVLNSIGTLGGGNHFIELDRDTDNNVWLVVHSGSRNFGLKVATWHQARARDWLKTQGIDKKFSRDLEYFPIDKGGQEYLDDMNVAQEYAGRSRRAMAKSLIEGFFKIDIDSVERVASIHNYINFKDKIIRKGAISARKGERVVIPFNMRDGTVIATGKGSEQWNNSAPHGAGRLMSRTKAKATLDINEFKSTMKGVWSSSINKHTLDEAPMVYKPMDMILDAIRETVDVDIVMKPIYNFKAN